MILHSFENNMSSLLYLMGLEMDSKASLKILHALKISSLIFASFEK